jgi:hypothetical protein
MRFVRGLCQLVIPAVLLAVGVGLITSMTQVAAGPRLYNAPSIAGTLAPAVIDTSTAISTKRCAGGALLVVGEMDSMLITVQGSLDATNWFTISTKQCDGTDGTFANQWYTPMDVLTTNSKNDAMVPLPNWIRFICNVNDVAGADTVSSLTIRFWCNI